jgi:outer membrane protein assembly factor BamB
MQKREGFLRLLFFRMECGGLFMKRFSALAVISLACADMANAQGRPLDWSSFGNDAQRTGWEKSDTRITKENVKDFQLVLRRKLENKQTLTPPVVIGLLISYRGFKELAFVAGSSDNMWAIDADMDRIFWKKHFEYSSDKPKPAASALCPGGLTAFPSLTPPINFSAARPARAPGAAAPPAAAPVPGSTTGVRGILGGTGFGAARPAFAVSSDGKLHVMNTSTGDDVAPAISFLPASAKASTLTVHDGTVYTTTSSSCGAASNGVHAIDLTLPDPKVATFELNGGDVSGVGGTALGTDGTVYVQTGPGPLDPASNKWSNTVLALSPKELKLKQYFTGNTGSNTKKTQNLNATTPVVFPWNGRDLIVSAGQDGGLYLLDSQSLGGEDHKTPLYQTAPLASAPNGIYGGLSTWLDQDGTRWVLAPVWGPANPQLKSLATNGAAPNGSIIAFKLEERDGKPVLTPAWVSRDLSSPVPPVITSGIVFALSTGNHATLYALDATTGKELYSTGNQVKTPANLTGMTVANGRVYFTTTDSTLYAFGIFLER